MKHTDNHGSLSRNAAKEKPTQPDHKGSCVVAGVRYWISAYINTDAETGAKYFKLYFKPKTEAPPAEPDTTDLSGAPEIPF